MGVGSRYTNGLGVLMMELVYIFVKERIRMEESMTKTEPYIFYQQTESELPN
jgi:hypothetical protein